jgi:NAD(P)-dependent dehydrogenase (short-subunit alcohol dehydrogenase family)/predicted flap endonuclease-1-like 5' DNA nuclease
MNLPDLTGTTVLVTGATSGVGRDGAVRLGSRGARVLVHGRDSERGAETVAAVEEAGGEASFHAADFADLEAVRDLAAEVRAATDGLDVLCNNAGLYTSDRHRTAQGLGLLFGVNHVAPFVLTHELAGHLNAGARVVTTSSVAHRFATLDLDLVERKRAFTGPGFERYCESKLANALFTRELARRLGDGTANCFHPGNIPGSGFTRDVPFPLSLGVEALALLPGLTESIADGGRALARLAADPDLAGVTGEYFDVGEMAEPAPAAKDDALARRLWDLTADVAGVESALPEGPATRGGDADGRASRGVRIDVTEADGESSGAGNAANDAGDADADGDGGVTIEVTDGDDGGATAVEVEVADEDDGTGGAVAEPPGTGSLTDINGVGPTTADALRAAGFETVTDVRAATTEELTAAEGVGPARASRIKADAGGE